VKPSPRRPQVKKAPGNDIAALVGFPNLARLCLPACSPEDLEFAGGQLTRLQCLLLPGTDMYGGIDWDDLSQLQSLTRLELSSQRGKRLKDKQSRTSLMHSVAELTRLEHLCLNHVIGCDTDFLPIAKALRHLEHLDLEHTSIAFTLPALAKAVTANFVSLKHLVIANTKVHDRGLEVVAKLTNLESLHAPPHAIRNAYDGFSVQHSMWRLTRLPRLSSLTVANLSTATTEHLSLLSALTMLNVIPYTILSSTAHLAFLPALRRLDLSWCRVTEGTEHLSRLTTLTFLDMSNTPIQDAGLEHFGALSALEVLRLDCTDVTGCGMGHIARAHALQELYLLSTQFHWTGVGHLSRLPALHTLHVSSMEYHADLAPFTNLTSLRTLIAIFPEQPSRQDLSALLCMPKLRELRVRCQNSAKCQAVLDQHAWHADARSARL
jgi:Leucine-rich repeat (LRR) protein